MSVLIKGMEMPKHAAVDGEKDTAYRCVILAHPDNTVELVIDAEFASPYDNGHKFGVIPSLKSNIPKPSSKRRSNMSAPNYNYHSPNYYEFDEFRNRNSKWRGIWVVDSFRVFERDGWRTRRTYKCSVCNSEFVGDGLFPTNYCPHCGADMRNEAEVE